MSLTARRFPPAFLAAVPPAVVFALVSVALVAAAGLDARRATVAICVLVIASGFVAAGLWVVARDATTRLGLLARTACLHARVALRRPLGPIVGHFLLAFPGGRLQRPADRWLVGAGYAVALALQPSSPPAPLRTTPGSPIALLSYPGPVSNDPATITFTQRVNATDPLRTGNYSKILTFTLTTTTP